MGQRQFYLDEDFPTHPKSLQAGGDASWLHICALAWASKHLTGRIPKNGLDQLSDRRRPAELAARLVAVGLWHDRGSHYELHDWETRNKKRLAARRKAKQAADSRWRNAVLDDGSSDAPSMPQALLNACSTVSEKRVGGHQSGIGRACSIDALDPMNQRTNDPTSLYWSSSVPPLKLVSAPALEEEGSHPQEGCA